MNSSDLKNKGKKTLIFILGCIAGAVLFGITFGYRIVNPTCDEWIFASGGDLAQHYLGWKYFRRTPWTFPLGLTDGLSSEGMVSCMYTDSIPLFAVFFKLLSPLLPETFQYIGLWELMSFVLMGGLSSILVNRFSRSTVFCLTGSVFYIMAPEVLLRALGHEALSGQWIVVAGILMWTYQGHEWKHRATPVIIWSLLCVLCVSVHVYFLMMMFLLMFGYVLTDICRKKRILHSVSVCGFSGAASLLCMFLQGAFYGDAGFVAGGLGGFSANYNAFFNSYGYSEVLRPLKVCNKNTEGFGYLGLGMIVLGALALVSAVICCFRKDTSFFRRVREIFLRYGAVSGICLLVTAISMFVAASPVGTFGDRVIYQIEYPYLINGAMMVFRASGRFIWVADYVLFTAFIAVTAKCDKKVFSFAVLSVCAAIQLWDIHGWISSLNSRYSDGVLVYNSPVQSAQWDEITEDRDTFVFLPLTTDYLSHFSDYEAFAEYGCGKGMKLTSFYFARSDYPALAEYAQNCLDDLKAGNGMDNAVYIFLEPEAAEDIDSAFAEILNIDGYTVALSK